MGQIVIVINEIHTLDQFSFYQVLPETRGPALVIFSGPRCGSCRYLKRIIQQQAWPGGEMRFFEVDAHEEPGLAHTFDVFHLPTLFLYRDGEYHCRIQSEARIASLHAAVATALTQAPEEEP